MLNHKDSDDSKFWKYSELKLQRWKMENNATVHSGNINSKIHRKT